MLGECLLNFCVRETRGDEPSILVPRKPVEADALCNEGRLFSISIVAHKSKDGLASRGLGTQELTVSNLLKGQSVKAAHMGSVVLQPMWGTPRDL